ncbi:hypothetical protein BGW80DRAFT_593377 [Lactifluus volemus]|nr:hypothetical protein BGW80DRAFT_593377 [Lactifluus volemus]
MGGTRSGTHASFCPRTLLRPAATCAFKFPPPLLAPVVPAPCSPAGRARRCPTPPFPPSCSCVHFRLTRAPLPCHIVRPPSDVRARTCVSPQRPFPPPPPPASLFPAACAPLGIITPSFSLFHFPLVVPPFCLPYCPAPRSCSFPLFPAACTQSSHHIVYSCFLRPRPPCCSSRFPTMCAATPNMSSHIHFPLNLRHACLWWPVLMYRTEGCG